MAPGYRHGYFLVGIYVNVTGSKDDRQTADDGTLHKQRISLV